MFPASGCSVRVHTLSISTVSHKCPRHNLLLLPEWSSIPSCKAAVVGLATGRLCVLALCCPLQGVSCVSVLRRRCLAPSPAKKAACFLLSVLNGLCRRPRVLSLSSRSFSCKESCVVALCWCCLPLLMMLVSAGDACLCH